MVTTPVITTELRTDSENNAWSTILITRTDGVETQRVTTYDEGTKATSGLIITTKSANGFVYESLSEDAGNNNAWSSIKTTFEPDSKIIASKVTTYDDATTNSETYSGGKLLEVVRTGDPAKQGFTQMKTTYDLETGGKTVVTDATSGQKTTDTFNANGDLVSRSQIDGVGADSSASWATVKTTYDTVDGVKTTHRTYTYDNGVTREETLLNDKIVTVVQTDSNTAAWDTITDTFGADGKMVSRLKVEDDGDTISEHYTAGKLDTVVRADISENPKLSWAQSTRTYDTTTGEMLTESLLMDNGMTVDKTMGQRDVTTTDSSGNTVTKTINFATKTVMQDTDTVNSNSALIGNKGWDTFTTNYGANGVRTSSTTVMDDTDVIERTYGSNGKVSLATKTDVNDNSDYETITKHYNQYGKLVSADVLRDDDVTVVTDYGSNGQRTHVLMTDTTDLASPTTTSLTDNKDGNFKWTSIDKTYDGKTLTASTVIYDNSNEISTSYDPTVQGDVVMTITRHQTGAHVPDGKEFWTDNVSTYIDGIGNKPLTVESTHVTTNLGRVTDVQFGDDGVRDTKLITDEGTGPNGSFTWDSIEMNFNSAGDMVSRQQVFDSGDQVLRLYDAAGDLTDVVLYDGDNSNNWVFRVTTFDDAGKGTTANIDASALPIEYMDYFDGVPGLPII